MYSQNGSSDSGERIIFPVLINKQLTSYPQSIPSFLVGGYNKMRIKKCLALLFSLDQIN